MSKNYTRQKITLKFQYPAIYLVIFATAMTCLLSSCSPENKGIDPDPAAVSQNTPSKDANALDDDNTLNSAPSSIPEIGRIRQICELVTVECHYHNVAKSKKSPGTGLKHLGETERTFWIEYIGIAELSFPVDQIEMRQEGTNVTITLPNPRVSCKVDPDSWNENSYVISEDQRIQKNPITAEDQTKAIELAQAEMVFKIRANSALFTTARLQAQELIQNYIYQIGELTGVTYHITWETP